MSIRAKFRVETVNRLMNLDGVSFSEELQMSAVYSSEERSENKAWAKWTPSGRLSMVIDNPGAQGKFVPNQEVFIDITEIPAGLSKENA